jgi:hypothetical protein
MEAHHEINRRRTAVKRIIIMALGVLLALALATPMALAQVGQGANKSGTAAELAAAWTQWAYSKPVGDSPVIGGDPDDYTDAQCDGTPVTPTQGKQWFLAGTTDGSKVVRTCTMPVGTHLFFPVVTSFGVKVFPFEDAEVERQKAITFINNVLADPAFRQSIEVTVDEKAVKSNRIVRATSPPSFFTVTLPEENAFDPLVPPEGVPGDVYEGWTTDALWVTLPPLPPGEHRIHFEMSAPNTFGGVSQDNTYILTVVNKGKRAL